VLQIPPANHANRRELKNAIPQNSLSIPPVILSEAKNPDRGNETLRSAQSDKATLALLRKTHLAKIREIRGLLFASMHDIDAGEHERAADDLHRAKRLTEERHRGNRRNHRLTEQRR
jgi:hypothetical protein